MRSLRIIFGLVLVLAFSVLSSFSQNQIDPTFNAVPQQEASATGKGQIVQPDDKVIVWGTALAANGQAKGQIVRLNVDGTIDPTFNYCGCHLIGVANVLLQADGKLLVAGGDSNNKAKMVRLNPDGSLDASYNPVFNNSANGSSSAYVWAVQTDGKSLVGRTEFIFGNITNYLYRYNADGSLDSSFTNGSITGGIIDLLLTPDGKYYLGTQVGSGPGSTGVIRRYNSNGTVDNSFERPILGLGPPPGPTTFLTGLALQPDGSLIICGKFDTVNGVEKPNIARVFPAGNVDLGFTVTGLIWGDRAKVLQSGKILVSASNGPGNPNKFYRLNSDGSMDGSFSKASVISSVLDRWVLDSTERIIFFGASNTAVQQFYRLESDGDLDAGFNAAIGDFGKIYAMARQPDGKLIISGIFTSVNGTARNSIARVNADGTLDPTFNSGTGFAGQAATLIVQTDGKILAYGTFSAYNGTPKAGLARINSDGSLDAAFDPAFNNDVQAVALQSDGKILVVGRFTSVNLTGRTGVARLNADGSLDNAFNPIVGGSPPNINMVIAQTDGKILFGGSFSGVNGFSRTGTARLNSDGTLDAAFNASGANARSVLQQPDGKYLFFASGIARRNNDGTADATFTSPGFSASSLEETRINAIVIQGDGSLVVGGNFNTVGGKAKRNFVRVSKTGKLDLLFFPNGANGEVRSMVGQPDGKIVVGGDFSQLDNNVRPGIVRISTVDFRNPALFDFDGDARADISVFRPSDGNWYLMKSQSGFSVQNFGLSGDLITPGDFDGDGITDLAIYRASSATWWYKSSINGAFFAAPWGISGDIPLAEDVNGDGRADYVNFRPSNSTWYRATSSGQFLTAVTFGQSGDTPVVGDFDGDGKADLAIFRPSTGTWWYRGANGIDTAIQWGQSGDVPVPGDYDGDGKTDAAIWRPSNGVWYILGSGGTYTATSWGLTGDRPVAADYDGDGKADIAIWRPSSGVWYILQSTAGFTGMQFGLSTDKAAPNAFLP